MRKKHEKNVRNIFIMSGTTQPMGSQQQQVNLATVVVENENSALNILVGFLGVAQRRGAYTLDEAAKIFECIKLFQRNVPKEN